MAGSSTTSGGSNNNMSGASKVCYNAKCGTTTSSRWRPGWHLRSGQVAELCDDCGVKYEQMKFCEAFHSEDEGWRSCNICNKRIHCGCVASFYSFTLADTGGIECINCINKHDTNPATSNAQHPILLPFQKQPDLPVTNLSETFSHKISQNTNPKSWIQVPNLWQSVASQPAASSLGRVHDIDKIKYEQSLEKQGGEHSTSISNKIDDSLSERMKNKDLKLAILDNSSRNGPVGKEISVSGSSRVDLLSGDFTKQADHQLENPGTSCLNISLGSLVAKDEPSPSILGLTMSSGSPDEMKEHNKSSATQPPRQRRQPLPKATTSGAGASESGKDTHTQIRVARPPGEGRGRSQLLPRYWPRITDQELQQISGDSNSVITPLFEKILSASDAGRIGRLVLPKACAEAYFPPISQPEGLPLKIQDAKGKEWVFQFRFWPNNNSRMYVLEGVTPCIQSMQLQAGDTVTFSRLDPEGKLVMGFRKASNSTSQECQTSTTGNGTLRSGGTSNSNMDLVPSLESLSVLPLHTVNGNSRSEIPAHAGHPNASDSGANWYKTDSTTHKLKEMSGYQNSGTSDKRRNYTPVLKSKRLRIENEDSLELKLTWEEAQDLLRPPPRAVPSIVTIEGHEFEEYEEPPVFGKRTIFTTNQSGEKHQWAQCDDCRSWRRLPVDAFLPPKWTCADNTWDPKRAFCSASQEVTSEELEKLIQLNAGSRKSETLEGQKVLEPSSGLDTLANVAVLGENDAVAPSAAATTKHPRHRPGCSCIVCIQPPSGKGPKHKPTCTCNVCMTVKRRFKTLMMRRKKRASEREAENARKKRIWMKDEGEVNSGSNWQPEMCSPSENSTRQDKSSLALRESLGMVSKFSVDGVKISSDINIPLCQKSSGAPERTATGKGQIDLNSHPEREEEPPHGAGRMSMMRLLHDAGLPLEMYLKQQGLASLVPHPTNSSNVGFEMHGNDQRIDEQSCTPPNLQSQEEVLEEQFLTPNRVKSDATSVSV